MTVEINDVIRVSAQMQYDPALQDVVNVYHFRQIGVSVSDLNAFADMGAILETMYTELLGGLSDQFSFTQYSAINITQDVLLGTAPWPTLTVGDVTAEMVSPQVAALVLANTTKPRVQGRKSLGGFVEANISDGGWVASQITALVDFALLYIANTTIGSRVWQPGVWNADLLAWTVFNAAVVMAFSRTQRRRSTGRGS